MQFLLRKMKTHIKSSIYIKNLDNVLIQMKEIDYIALIDEVIVDHTIYVYQEGFKLTSVFSEKITNN